MPKQEPYDSVEVGTLPRTDGKAVRVIGERNKQNEAARVLAAWDK